MEFVSKDIATASVTKWMDSKRIRPSKRLEYKSHVESLITAVEECLLVVEDDNTLTQKLLWPIGEGINQTSELKYKHRCNSEMVKPYLKNVDSNDADGRLNAYVCALTDMPIGIVGKIDSEDKNVSQSIAVFFL